MRVWLSELQLGGSVAPAVTIAVRPSRASGEARGRCSEACMVGFAWCFTKGMF